MIENYDCFYSISFVSIVLSDRKLTFSRLFNVAVSFFVMIFAPQEAGRPARYGCIAWGEIGETRRSSTFEAITIVSMMVVL